MSPHPNPERHARYCWAEGIIDGGRVLDAGCGVGWGTTRLADKASEAIGVDISSAAIADARSAYGKIARFEQADLRDLPFDDDEFDYAICFETIAQIAQIELALDELRRVLRSAGTLLISSPNPTAYPPGNPLHVREIDPERLEALLGERFANVAVHRQQSYHASLLGPAAMLAHDEPATPVAASVVKAVGGVPGSELHTVAAASDGELPAPPAWIALGELVDYREQQVLLEEWRERAVKAEARVAAQARKLRSLEP